MIRRVLMSALAVVFVSAVGTARAVEYGSAGEAKTMLEKAVAAVKADKAGALQKFTTGESGFKDRDLYPYCGGPDGSFTAHPTLAGKSLKDLKDKAGKPIGEEIYKNAKEGQISEFAYKWPRPGQTDPVRKVAFYTKIGDQVCAVGYYE
jgi:signal transduction histidine kinase